MSETKEDVGRRLAKVAVGRLAHLKGLDPETGREIAYTTIREIIAEEFTAFPLGTFDEAIKGAFEIGEKGAFGVNFNKIAEAVLAGA